MRRCPSEGQSICLSKGLRQLGLRITARVLTMSQYVTTRATAKELGGSASKAAAKTSPNGPLPCLGWILFLVADGSLHTLANYAFPSWHWDGYLFPFSLLTWTDLSDN